MTTVMMVRIVKSFRVRLQRNNKHRSGKIGVYVCARACMWEGIGGNIIIIARVAVLLRLSCFVWEALVRLDTVAWNPSPNICRSFTTSDSNNPLCCNGLFVWRLSFSFPSLSLCGEGERERDSSVL